ncbi:hypothetical protein C8Q73DRAFT_470497 [Cubamyces lactineus]|nr:hypothetical protein C8Q73DRAFT_470497 [Cubamyces lactineus]
MQSEIASAATEIAMLALRPHPFDRPPSKLTPFSSSADAAVPVSSPRLFRTPSAGCASPSTIGRPVHLCPAPPSLHRRSAAALEISSYIPLLYRANSTSQHLTIRTQATQAASRHRSSGRRPTGPLPCARCFAGSLVVSGDALTGQRSGRRYAYYTYVIGATGHGRNALQSAEIDDVRAKSCQAPATSKCPSVDAQHLFERTYIGITVPPFSAQGCIASHRVHEDDIGPNSSPVLIVIQYASVGVESSIPLRSSMRHHRSHVLGSTFTPSRVATAALLEYPEACE